MNDSECPLVSIIIPVYNVKPYLNEALDSVINQTYKNLEIIVIDDGSTDGSETICDEYAAKDSRIRLIHQENQGLSAARNKGLDIMQGTIVSFLDSDDAFDPKMIETMLSVMLQDDIDVVICRYVTFQKEWKKKSENDIQPILPSGIYDRKTILQSITDGHLNIMVWNRLYKAALWKDNRFPVGQDYEDIISLQIIYQTRRINVIPDILYLHRDREGSITTTPTIKRFYDWIAYYETYETFVALHTPEIFTEEQIGRIMRRRISGMIGFYIRLSQNKVDSYSLTEVRKTILATSNGISPSFRNHFAFQLLHYCPQLFDVLYPIYSFFRLFVKYHKDIKHIGENG